MITPTDPTTPDPALAVLTVIGCVTAHTLDVGTAPWPTCAADTVPYSTLLTYLM